MRSNTKKALVLMLSLGISLVIAISNSGCDGEDPQCGTPDNPCPKTDGGGIDGDSGTTPTVDGGNTGDAPSCRYEDPNFTGNWPCGDAGIVTCMTNYSYKPYCTLWCDGKPILQANWTAGATKLYLDFEDGSTYICTHP